MVFYFMEPSWRFGWDINSVEIRTFKEIVEIEFSSTVEYTLILSIQMVLDLVTVFMYS